MFDERLAASLASWPDNHTAVVDEDCSAPRVVTYGELRRMIENYRVQLRALGLGASHLVPILARQTPETVALTHALLLEAAAFCFLSERFRPSDRRWLIEQMNPIGLVVDAHGAALLSDATKEEIHVLRPILLEVDGIDAASVRETISVAGECPVLAVGAPIQTRSVRAGSVCSLGAAHAHFSSGSTGRPKAVLGSRGGLAHFADVQIDGCSLSSADRLLCILGFSSNLGLVQMFTALFTGASLHLTQARTNRALGDIIRRSGITGIGGSTGFWTAAMAGMPAERMLFGEVPTLRYVSTGGLHMPRSKFRQLTDRLGADVVIYEIYGQAEVRQMTHFPINAPENRGRVQSVGRAVAHSVLFIARDERSIAPIGTVGEIAHCGPGIMLGYLGQPELTKNQLRSHDSLPGKTVVYTGDFGYQDENGYIYIKGRGSRKIELGDTVVWPADIEDVLAVRAGVSEAVVTGVVRRGTVVVAAAVVVNQNVEPEELRDSLARELPKHMVPSHIAIWSTLPTTPNGKPSIRSIEAKLAEELESMADDQ